MTVSTSQNLTILGVLTILGALVNGALEYLQTKTVNLAVLLTAVSGGLAMIMAKGAKSTGGTVDAAGNPVTPPAP
jgi:hypothetical protein